MQQSSPSTIDDHHHHIPVLADEAIKMLNVPRNDGFIIDMTFGAGGHTKKILAKSNVVKIFCLDRDPIAYEYARELKRQYPDQIYPLLGKFSDLPQLLKPYGIRQNSIDAILFDFGCSSMQFDDGARGFAISKNGPLDMRMNQNEDCPTAAELLEKASEEDLYRIIKYYGEEKMARKIARTIVETRYAYRRLETTEELTDLIVSAVGTDMRLDKLGRFAHVATKTFQALRIFVNNELNEINYGMVLAQKYLKIGGTLVALSFHSLEDTIVKRHITDNVTKNAANKLPLKFYSCMMHHEQPFLEQLLKPSWSAINKHVITPDEYEMHVNPRSRSAKLRACIKV